MHERVHDGKYTNQDTSHFVEVYVIVQWQHRAEPVGTQESNALPQHQDQDEHAVKVEALTCRNKNDKF